MAGAVFDYRRTEAVLGIGIANCATMVSRRRIPIDPAEAMVGRAGRIHHRLCRHRFPFRAHLAQ